MNPRMQAQIAEGNFTRNMVDKGQEWKDGVTDWAGNVAERMRDNLKKAGYHTDHYVRSHPGRVIAGACCFGLAAGDLLGRAASKRR